MRPAMMPTAFVVTVATLLPTASAFWRMLCPSRLIDARMDPIMSPGSISPHVHTIAGGNGFGYTMDYEQARNSSCSSCPVQQDLSAYWTPRLYYQFENGSFIGVDQRGDIEGRSGGMNVYYNQYPGPNNDKLYAYPPGFRMTAGNPFKRNFTGDYAAQAIIFKCISYPDGPQVYTNELPAHPCKDGIRAQVNFPPCWDGVNLYSEDNAHMSYPETGTYRNGTCPSTHPVHMIHIFYEVIYWTNEFEHMWYGDKQPFVFAQGDPTGYGFHGDFYNGWDVDVLQNAVDNCFSSTGAVTDCPYFTEYSFNEQQSCKIPPTLSTIIDGVVPLLPGCNNVTWGPEMAVPPTTCHRIPSVIEPTLDFTDMSDQGFRYLGCGSDDTANPALTGDSMSRPDLTVDECVANCKSQGYTYAGMEFHHLCFCGNSIPLEHMPILGMEGGCTMACGGNSSQICGGQSAISLYQACGGFLCLNVHMDAIGGLPSITQSSDA